LTRLKLFCLCAAVAEVPAVPAHEIPEIPAVPAVAARGVASIKTVLVGEQFSYGNLPKAIISAEPAPINPLHGNTLNVSSFQRYSCHTSMSLKIGLKSNQADG
jgi:hypothetical protein